MPWEAAGKKPFDGNGCGGEDSPGNTEEIHGGGEDPGRPGRGGDMTFQAMVYRILIASANDVIAEQRTIQKIILSWNATYSSKMKALLLPFMWEAQLVQESSVRPKVRLNIQLAKDCDILIGAFWTRIGIDTGVAESGTIEVIKEFQKAGKPVMLYFSSVPVVPSSIDLKQYEKLMNFMNECLKQGFVERYDSILDFREKLSKKIASKILEIHRIPEVQISRIQGETTKKESNNRISEQFCDLIGRYHLDWTNEKKIVPVSLDDGREILKGLERDMLNFKVPIAKIFSKETMENIDQVILKIIKLQKHRLYFDNTSYKDFWKLGDEIFASLDSIAGKVRKHIHRHTYSKD